MTKLEIYYLEQANTGKVYLFPEGMFYKAYEASAYILCTNVHPFKISARPLKGLPEPLASVGFPMSALEKYSSGMSVSSLPPYQGVLQLVPDKAPDMTDFRRWKGSLSSYVSTHPREDKSAGLKVYGVAYRLTLELTALCAGLDRRYRYSLGEDVRRCAKDIVLSILLAGKNEEKEANIRAAMLALDELQLCLRMMSDLKVIPDKRYLPLLEMSDDISKHINRNRLLEICLESLNPWPGIAQSYLQYQKGVAAQILHICTRGRLL